LKMLKIWWIMVMERNSGHQDVFVSMNDMR